MPFKINIGTKEGNTYKLETEAEALLEKALHDKIQGQDISPDLAGYEFKITGASDKAGFTAMENVEGIGLKKVLLTWGKAMKKRPRKEGKKKRSKNRPKGLRLRKTVRGKVISPAIVQINLKILKQGNKKLSEIFPDQNKKQEVTKVEPEQKPVEESQSQSKSNVKGDTRENSKQKGEAPNTKEETKPEDAESKEEGAKEKEQKEEQELAQPEKEPTSKKV